MTTISRHVIVKAPPEKTAEIQRVWKEECAPLMIKAPGCLREELLICREDPSEFISVAEWESEEAIQAFRASPDYEQIKNHARGMTGAAATVKTYTLAGG